jgi:hypothetical protein
VLLVFGAPCQLRLLAGQEHGRTIPLADLSQLKIGDPTKFIVPISAHSANIIYQMPVLH